MYIFFVPHKYPVEVVVLCPDVETIKGRERYREKTGYSGFTVETLYDTFMQTTPRIGFWPVSYTHLDVYKRQREPQGGTLCQTIENSFL